jgi:hypothetical protein
MDSSQLFNDSRVRLIQVDKLLRGLREVDSADNDIMRDQFFDRKALFDALSNPFEFRFTDLISAQFILLVDVISHVESQFAAGLGTGQNKTAINQ